MTDVRTIRNAIENLGLTGKPTCIHSSFRSFGLFDGGPQALIDGMLEAGCTVMVPTFSWGFLVSPPHGFNYVQNGVYFWDDPPASPLTGFTPECNEIDIATMGAIPKCVLEMPGRVRGNHPLCSFTAIGPESHNLIDGQTYIDVYAPFDRLEQAGGSIILMGVGYNKCTLLHHAESRAGIQLTRRWARAANGEVVETANGSCSSGFDKLEDTLASIANTKWVGRSYWRAFSASAALRLATDAIKRDYSIRHCGHPDCRNCNDVSKGGPILDKMVPFINRRNRS